MNRNFIRPVTVASVCGNHDDPAVVLGLAEKAAAQHPDVIMLPENWQHHSEKIDSEMILHLRMLARENHTYIMHLTYLIEENGLQYNTALMIDRKGEICGRYDKIYPFWDELNENAPGALNQPIVECDFGKVAMLICFDANFPNVWENAARQGAELVLWSSAYGAGCQLAAHAMNHHYNIVSCTTSGHCMAFDINGERIVNTKGDQPYVQWVTLDLDRCIFHENFNTEKLDALLSENPPKIEVEKHWYDEQWIIVRSAQEGVSARETCRAAGMEDLRSYKRRSMEAIDEMRRNLKG